MNAEFRLLWQEIGGDGPLYPRSTIAVPVAPASSLVLVRNAGKGSPGKEGDIAAVEIDKNKASGALSDYLKPYYPDASNSKRAKLEKTLLAAIWDALNQDGKLLSVNGKVPGSPKLKLGGVTQQFAVMKPRPISVSFKFIKHLDDKQNVVRLTDHDPQDVSGFLTDMNWIFGAQANVWFSSKNSDWVEIRQHLPQPLTEQAFKDHVQKRNDSSADVTLFLVGQWARSEGSMYAGANVIALPDHPQVMHAKSPPPANPKSSLDKYEYVEGFTLVMAHELAHFANGTLGHYDKVDNVLLSGGIQSTVIHPEHQNLMNAPGRKVK